LFSLASTAYVLPLIIFVVMRARLADLVKKVSGADLGLRGTVTTRPPQQPLMPKCSALNVSDLRINLKFPLAFPLS
jgi:hypothetical protein